MKTLTVISQKGGVGKSTLTANLAGCAARHGLGVVLIDLDPQGSVHGWNESRAGGQRFSSVRTTGAGLPAALALAERAGIGLALIDTAPRSDAETLVAARRSDLALIVTQPQRFDLEAAATTINLMLAAKVAFAVVLNLVPQGFRLAERARALLQQQDGIIVLPHMIRRRATISNALTDGRTAQEAEPDGPAAAEIEAVFAALARRLDLPLRAGAPVAAAAASPEPGH
ncbi:ParA family protein [Rhodovastum atsumiense]|uniref:nucleotide-binding protein n=1 Tax=Rhodovastum atsumiense TaxID=504468 RepID=UPI00139F2ABE|nr:AAA family ATPase [Rhodovastum atsumiense]CAH2602069.1 ParA family protein [Rhodovastum atsumiense]